MITTYFIIYFLLCFVLPSVRIYRQMGINPITFKNSGNAHDLIGIYMKFAIAATLFSALEADQILPWQYEVFLNHEGTKIAGTAIMLIALIWIIIAQIQMSSSWRIGIDSVHKTELRSHGLFGVSRNPIFLGMLVSQIGFTLYHATTLNIVVYLISYLLISIQVRLEEEHLTHLHQELYVNYQKRVSRWLF